MEVLVIFCSVQTQKPEINLNLHVVGLLPHACMRLIVIKKKIVYA